MLHALRACLARVALEGQADGEADGLVLVQFLDAGGGLRGFWVRLSRSECLDTLRGC
jgi:hypothetical protein